MAVLGMAKPAAAVDSVHVDASGGVPRLLVDGRPVRPRVFWGGPGSRPLRVREAWQELSFEFTPSYDEPNHATMHLRFGLTPGDRHEPDSKDQSPGDNATKE